MRTLDPDEAGEAITQAYLPSRVDRQGAGPLDLRLDSLRLASATAGLISFGAPARVHTVEASHYHVNVPIRGQVVSRLGGGSETRTVPGQATVFMPHRRADILWGRDATQLCLMIPTGLLEHELEMLGASISQPLEFAAEMDLSGPAASGLRASLQVVMTQLSHDPASSPSPRLGHHVERLVVDALLLAQPHNYSEALAGGEWRPRAGTVARARELLEERPEEPWSTSRLATHVHMSVRSLQEGFASQLGVPPMKYLQQVRLRKAREKLLSASPAETTVASVATGLGLSHRGRFAAAYRREFAESPADTLRQRSGRPASKRRG